LDRYDEALKCAEQAVALESNNTDAWVALGIAASSLDNYERALEAFRKAAEVGKPSAELWRLQAIALWFLTRYDEALKCAQQAVTLEPNNADAWVALGRAASGLGNHERALEAFRKDYPGSRENIEQALVWDWSRDPWAMACETIGLRPGMLSKLWPHFTQPCGRIHFAGAYCDNLNHGQDAATRSAHRVAHAIDAA